MLPTLIRKIASYLICFLMIITCASCKVAEHIKTNDYLKALAYQSGISFDDDYLVDLKNWGVIENEKATYDEDLKYEFLLYTASNICQLKETELIEELNIKNVDSYVLKAEALQIIDEIVEIINNPKIVSSFDYVLKDEIALDKDKLQDQDLYFDEDENKYYRVRIIDDTKSFQEIGFEEVFDSFELTDDFEIDFSKAEITPTKMRNSAYVNNKYKLLASGDNSFEYDDFEVSYRLNGSGIDVSLIKDIKGLDLRFDFSLINVKPRLKWTYKEGDFKNCYFDLSFTSLEKLGIQITKYKDYYLDLKDLDGNSFINRINNLFKEYDDEVIASIPICEVKTPIPALPTASLNFEILVNLYVSGKAEIVLNNHHVVGFETKDGNYRQIFDNDHDLDAIIMASTGASLGINLNVSAFDYRLLDIELDGGIKALVKPIIHIYDSDNNLNSFDTNIPYSTLNEISNKNEQVKLCADVSLYWLLDLQFNTSKTLLYRFGLNKTFHLSDEENQIFKNKSHIENGFFVDHCTVKKHQKYNDNIQIESSIIVLDSYAEVLKRNEKYEIKVLNLPKDYVISDLVITSIDPEIAKIEGFNIIAIKPGSTKIEVATKDLKYTSYINILVSTA